jgi:succinate-semialdehyde dehydrogenase/glutarate-semialdehyde dehydrogenase
MAIATVNPTTGETLQTFEPLSDEAVEERIARAAAAFEGYRLTTAQQRAGWLRSAADVLETDTKAVAELMTTEMGKTLAAAEAEVGKCVKALRYYADHGEDMLQPQPADASAVGAVEAYVVHQPLGVVLAVMPWNFPMWQAMRFAAPALMAGNVGLLKHASNVPQTALYLEELFRKAGFPDDVFQTLLIGSGQVEAVLRDDRVVAATLTGSNAAGQAVARVAGDVIKKTVLELGGSDPFIVMPSADLDRAAEVGGDRALPEQRAELHRRQALLRARRRGRRVHPAVRREARGAPVGDPMDAAPRSARWPPSPAGRTSRATWPTPSRRAPPSSPAASGSTGPAGLRADPGDRGDPGDGHLVGGGVRPGRRAARPSPTWTRRSGWPTTTSTAWARTCGPRTRASGCGSSATSGRAWRSSTA